MKIYFARHGESESNKKGIITGTLDSRLTDEGIEQVKKISLEMPTDFSEIYSCDSTRCQQTTKVFNEKLNISITYDSRLRQRDFGSLGGKRWEELGEDLRKIDRNQEYDYRPLGGEHVDEVRNRIFSFIENIKSKHLNKKILVVTSGGIIRLLYKVINKEIRDFVPNSSIHEFEFND